MMLRRFAAAFVVALVGTAVLANTAFGSPTTYASRWYTNSVTLSGNLAAKDRLRTNLTLKTTVGGVPVHLIATGLECISCLITNAALTENPAKIAVETGKIKFTGVYIGTPTGCTVRPKPGGTKEVLETPAMIVHFDWMNGTKFYADFAPETGTLIAKMYIEGGGCEAIEGFYNITGTLFGEATEETGVAARELGYEFSAATQAEGGALQIGSQEAEPSGALGLELASSEMFELH